MDEDVLNAHIKEWKTQLEAIANEMSEVLDEIGPDDEFAPILEDTIVSVINASFNL